MKRIFFPALLLLAGCNRNDPDQMVRVSFKVSEKVVSVLPSRSSLPGFVSGEPDSIEGRVRLRFRTDRYLSEAGIEIVMVEDGLHLRGIQVDPLIRRRALELAESTVGVERVVDEMTAE